MLGHPLVLDLQLVLIPSHVLLQPLHGFLQNVDVLLLLFDNVQELVLVKGEASGIVS